MQIGDVEMTDFDGVSLPEKEMVKRWGVMFTPTLVFLPEDVSTKQTTDQAKVAMMPGAFGRYTTEHLLRWVVEKGYEGAETFQKYHARKLNETRSN